MGEPGDIFGKLTLIKPHDSKLNSNTFWTCKCECGNEAKCRYYNLKSGNSTSCGCKKLKYPKDLTGLVFGRLLVIRKSEKISKHQKSYWICLCDCGKEFETLRNGLTSGKTNSCGCSTSLRQFDSLSGKRFGRLIVEGHCGKASWGRFYYRCVCDCGNVAIVKNNNLTSGHTRSCGCLFEEARKNMTGENHPFWNPELTNEERELGRGYPEYKKWRSEVYERDNYICFVCDQKKRDINAHHIFPHSTYRNLRLNIPNGITLCKSCHDEFHSLFGKKTTNLFDFLCYLDIKFENENCESLKYLKDKSIELQSKLFQEKDSFEKVINNDFNVIQEIIMKYKSNITGGVP